MSYRPTSGAGCAWPLVNGPPGSKDVSSIHFRAGAIEKLIKVVTQAGGFGTRLAEETDTLPKPMFEVGGRPRISCGITLI
jgi:hypothetical protein